MGDEEARRTSPQASRKKEIAELKRQPGKDITITGSGEVVRALLGAGLLEELRFIFHPLILGNGKRLFEDMDDRRSLEFVDTMTLGTGVLRRRSERI
jgi:dihydrofolate reductase